MAYGLKYTLSFLSDRGNDYRIEILKKDYQGAPIAKKMGVAPVLNIAQGDGCIQGTSLTFAVQADVDGELQEFYTTDNKKFQVLLYRNGAIMWQGYLLPELYSETYVAPPYDVSLTATDQLATLKDIEYSREDEQVLLQSVLEYLLSHTQLSLPLSYHMQLSMSLGRPMLENVYINQSAYNGSNCYDVLNAILLSMNCQIMQLGNQWLVTSATDNSENYYTERNLEVRPHKTLGQMYVADVYPNGTLGLVNSPALKGATLEYNHIFKKSILKNADCESRVGWEYMSHSSDDGRLPGEITSFGKIFKAYCWQLMPKNIQKDASLHLWQDVEMPADDGVTWSLSFKHLFSTNAKLLLLAITHWDDRGVQRRLTGEGWVTQWNNSDVNSYIQVTGTPKSASLAEYSDIEQYEMSTVQFTLPPSNGTLRIGFINSTANYADPLAFAPIYVTQVYLTLGAVSGSAATTTIEPNATMGQESVVLAMGDDVDSSNAVNVALNTLRRYDGGAIAGWMIGDRQFSSYFSMMLQEYSRYFGQKKKQLQGTIMGIDVLANIYKETYSNTVYRLVSADYNLLADEANVTLEEVLSNFVQFAEQIFATNNSNSFGSPASGGSFSGGSSSVDTSQLLRRDEAAETYATKAALADVNKEIADINNDLDALNELLNSDVSGVINTWGEIVDFLDEYNESQDLASILSQMNSDIANRVHYDDFEKLQEAVDANYGVIQTLQGYFTNGVANNAAKLGGHAPSYFATAGDLSNYVTAFNNYKTATDKRLTALEGYWYVDDNGNLHTSYNVISDNDVIAGGEYSGGTGGGGGGTGGFGSITIKTASGQEYKTNSNGVVTIPDYQPKGNYLTTVPSGYATESWVSDNYQPKGNYLTGITSAMVTTALGYVPFNSTSFTKATIKSTLGIADWALAATKPTYTASEVGALSAGGGTISGSSSTILTINRTGGTPYVCFNKDGSLLGFLGIHTEGYPVFVDSGGVSFQMLHSANYSSYALPLSGGTLTGPLTVNGGVTCDHITRYDSNAGYLFGSRNTALGLTDGGALVYAYGNTPISMYTNGLERMRVLANGNVLIGTTEDNGGKLQVNGNIGLFTGVITWLHDGANYSIQIKDDGQAYYKAYYGHHFYAGGVERVNITSDGNLLVGTTINSGARVHINASAATTLQAVTTTTGLGIAQFLAPAARTGITGGMVLDFGVASSTYNSGNIAFRHHSSGNAANFVSIGLYGNDNILNVFGSGNVAIGTTDSNPAYKLDVAGNVRMTGTLTSYGDGLFGSDARYKCKLQDLAVDVKTIAYAPVFSYKWTDREDDKVHLGTTAQYWLDTNFKDAVDTSNKDFFHLNYGALGVAIGVTVAKKVVSHEERIKELEERVKNLEIENKQLRQWHN
ncbi:MAG: hypothetical protein J6R57_03045 [Bacteroidales bacterium]|nr:hypothetical protein [Bacteroidales bacterium]